MCGAILVARASLVVRLGGGGLGGGWGDGILVLC
jgi:hypothetical protein